MGDDIQIGQQNPAGAQTNLNAQTDQDGTWPGDFVFNVDASGLLFGRPISGIRAVGQEGPGMGIVGIGQVGVVGQGTVGVVGQVGQSDLFPPVPLDNTGVVGVGGSIGVQGSADVNDGIGVQGTATGAVGTGVTALATGLNGMGLFASDFDENGREVGQAAGWFDGRLVVDGDLIVFGAKGAVVRRPDGSHRMLYAIESPESWFEDFGEGRLIKGKAKVKLERGFASVIKESSFHVFLTPYGDSNGLYVSQRSKDGFEVREQGNGKASVRFSYRIVAKRKDISGERLAKIAIPKAKPKRITR